MKDLIQSKLKDYTCKTVEEEENAIKEITQEIALYALYQSGFFRKAHFQGGTCLRIIHGLDRFSEDLDFALAEPTPAFEIDPFVLASAKIMEAYGYHINVSGKDKENSNIRMRFLKDDSIKMLLELQYRSDLKKKIKIKVEVDINPPMGASSVQEFIDFPTDFSVAAHDLPSLFAGKCHALLCRDYTKGRDWYDFSWYVAKGVPINYTLLSNALNQTGPWQDKNLHVSDHILEKLLRERIAAIDWKAAARDVSRFLRPETTATLALWSEAFFSKKIEKMLRRQ